MSIMWFQDGAVTLQIYGLPVVCGKNPVAAGLLQAAAQITGLIATVCAGRGGILALCLAIRIGIYIGAICSARLIGGISLAADITSLALCSCTGARACLALLTLTAGLSTTSAGSGASAAACSTTLRKCHPRGQH